MDWRSGSRQNPTGSAFRGISSRSRGRGRGKGVPPRGSHAASPHATSSSVTPAPPSPLPPSPLPPLPAQAIPPLSSNPSTLSNLPSRRGSHQPPRHTQSLSHLDISRPPVAPSIEINTSPGSRPQLARRAFPNSAGLSTPSLPSLKLDQPTPTTPGTPRLKTPRKRSNNRGRSSSKASAATQQISSAPSTSTLKDKSKEHPPHMAFNSGPPDAQSFDPRTDIDLLVERVRAMAMAGSAIDKEKDREGTFIPQDGHIDWAGDEDDGLPDLDDWVRPKPVQTSESKMSSENPSLPPVEELTIPNPPSVDKGMQQTSGLNEPEPEDNVQQAQDNKNSMKLQTVSKGVEPTLGKTKSRGRHGRKKSTVSDAIVPTLATQTSAGFEIQSSEALGPAKPRPALVHPLPPKPQLSASPVRGFKSRGPAHANPPVTRVTDNVSDELPSATPQKDQSVELPPTQAAKPLVEAESPAAPTTPEPQVRKSAFDPSVDWANAPRSEEQSTVESVHEDAEAPSSSVGHSPDTDTRTRAFDPTVDWSKAPSIPPTRQSPTRLPRSSHISSPSASSNSRTASPRDRSHGPPPRYNASPRSSARSSPHPPPYTRSQMNSPERSPHRWQDRMGPTHLRAHSSPQTGSGRPVITLDARSRLLRTLGVPGTTTPPRGPAPEVVVAD